MTNKIEELKKDIAELENLEKQATRQKVKDLFSIEIRKLVSEVVKLEEQNKNIITSPTSSSFSVASSVNKRYEVKITNYAWDQTDKFVKFYVTLKNVHTIPAENIKCEFTPKSLLMTVSNLDNKDHALRINNFLKIVDPNQSTWRVKTDTVIINVAKLSSENWSHVTEWEKKSSDQKTPKLDTDNVDPSEGLMSLMKNMYEKGDDEMKRTIAKAWTESQNKGPAF